MTDVQKPMSNAFDERVKAARKAVCGRTHGSVRVHVAKIANMVSNTFRPLFDKQQERLSRQEEISGRYIEKSDRQKRRMKKQQATIAERNKKIKRLREALKECQWKGIKYETPQFGYCITCERLGYHTDDCKIAAALAQQPGSKEEG